MSRAVKKRLNKRRRLYAEQKGLCWICGRKMSLNAGNLETGACAPNYATFDHIHPKSQGGIDGRENLKLAHHSCNQKRADRSPHLIVTTGLSPP